MLAVDGGGEAFLGGGSLGLLEMVRKEAATLPGPVVYLRMAPPTAPRFSGEITMSL